MKSSNSNPEMKDPVNINNNIISKAINRNIKLFSEYERICSNSELPSNFMKNELINLNHKISKSELFNFQFDIKKILDELERKKKIEQENYNNKLSKKKMLILDKFMNCIICIYLVNSQFDFSYKPEKGELNICNIINKIPLNTPIKLGKNHFENLTFKKQSPEIYSRYKSYNENGNNLLKVEDIKPLIFYGKTNINSEGFKNNEIKDFNLDNKDNFSKHMITQDYKMSSETNKSSIINLSSELKNINNTKNSSNLKIAYNHFRKKSSLFNSEDLGVSKQENFKTLIQERSVNKNLFNMFGINSNKSSNIVDFDHDKHFAFINDSSLVKIRDSKSEISQNNYYNETEKLTSNPTNMISYINNTNLMSNNKNVNTNINLDINLFDFKDSPLNLKFPKEHHNYLSYDSKSNPKESNSIQNKNTTHNFNTLNKKTKSLDNFSISNQVNINIVYNNTKKKEDITKVLYINLELIISHKL